jgi:type IV secretory pathway VirB6-like protein
MIVIFGVGFLIGVVQASFGQVLIRLAKIGIILTMISPAGWQFFSNYAVKFFNDGTDELIGKVMEIGTGVAATANQPFVVLDGIAKVVLSPDMIIAIMGAVFNSGPYGLSMGGLLAFGVFGLLKMLISGLRLYAISFVMRSLMLGVAPLFIVFLLFDKTKQLFSGWVNILVLLSLRPILYFTFISFFLVMLISSTTNMMGGNELCWVAYKGAKGGDNKLSFWKFKDKDGNFSDIAESDWDGLVTCRLNGGKQPDGSPCKPFPLNIVDILSFLILVFVAGKFATVTESISNEISNSYLNIDQQARAELRGLAGGERGGNQANRNAANAPPPTGNPTPGTRR